MSEPNVFSSDSAKVRNEFSLNGLWELQAGSGEKRPQKYLSVVPVPGLVDLAVPSYNWDEVDYHWYRTHFTVDDDEMPTLAFLRINQAQFGTVAWLNGKEIGSSISCYTSQEYRIDSVLKLNDLNELIVRIGAKGTLPPESAVGKDQEKERFIPGVWGDVSLMFCGNPRIQHVQIIPHIDKAIAEVVVTLENTDSSPKNVSLSLRVSERVSRKFASERFVKHVETPASQLATATFMVPIENVQLWSPDSPFLYELESAVSDEDGPADLVVTVFGMRKFGITGKGFFLNGKRIFLKGGNIAFHRFLSDKERMLLPWNREWIMRALIEIPKEHHFNFFRNHLGQMYSAWYDIADEHGMLIQNEWHFWGATGSTKQISKEFTEWIRDNCNHPSIIMWDALNESSDEHVQQEIVPRMKLLDPTRPWESVDFVEEHPYIYSLGPVLNNTRFGFTRALEDIENSATPTMLNEFVWWWLNSNGEPTYLMKGVTERWLGPESSKGELLEHQAFLAQELVELFRRMRVDAIQPFVYLSNNNGPTAHWFLGPIEQLKPKPILAALKNAFAPFGISLELWDRHFFTGEKRLVNTWVFNDEPQVKEGMIRYGVTDSSGVWVWEKEVPVIAAPSDAQELSLEFEFPSRPGVYHASVELHDRGSGRRTSVSRKVAHVLSTIAAPGDHAGKYLAILERSGEYRSFFEGHGIRVCDVVTQPLGSCGAVVIGEGVTESLRTGEFLDRLSNYVSGGGYLVIIEPEFGIQAKCVLPVLRDLDIVIEPREDADRGGYDSYVFASDLLHPLWVGISREHLKMFNGGYGGEVVSQHNLVPSVEPIVHARSGIALAIPAIMEIPYGKGKVIISRLQTRGRLSGNESTTNAFARRPDPVLQRFMLNLLRYAFAWSNPVPTMAMKNA